MPALDNGEWIWGLRAVAHQLTAIGQNDLAKEYLDYFYMLANNVMMVFYGGGGRIRAVTQIKNTKAQPTPRPSFSFLNYFYYLKILWN